MTNSSRLNRLLAADGRCFDVAIDHGFFNERMFLNGIEDMRQAVATIVDAQPDAVQLTVGTARHLQDVPGKTKPSLVLRTDIANVYGSALPRSIWSRMIEHPVEQALKLDAACVVVNLLLLPDQPDLHAQCVENICRLKPACERYGMPLMIEPLVMQPNDQAGGYMVDGDIDKILPLVRQAAELGADVIKADPCDDVREYHRVIAVASGIPVLVRGGGRASDEEILARTAEVMRQGASGIVYGRNVVQHARPAQMTRALMAIVHEHATAEQALELIHNKN
ncbi:MAG: aldolase [Roseiflexaceae bacterium]|nr:aldolase [Roseiflexaceae bacterium]